MFNSHTVSFASFQKSGGCAIYAMLQHYLWLVVFCWMIIEGIQMYLSLVQVFDSHIFGNMWIWRKLLLILQSYRGKFANPPEEFKLKLFIKPYIDIVSKDVTC